MSTPSATQTKRSGGWIGLLKNFYYGTRIPTFCETDAHGIAWPYYSSSVGMLFSRL